MKKLLTLLTLIVLAGALALTVAVGMHDGGASSKSAGWSWNKTFLLADPDFGPGNSNKGPHDPGAKCHPPGQTVDLSECK